MTSVNSINNDSRSVGGTDDFTAVVDSVSSEMPAGCSCPTTECPPWPGPIKSLPKEWVDVCFPLGEWKCVPKVTDGAPDPCGFPGQLSVGGKPVTGLVIANEVESTNVATLVWDGENYRIAGVDDPEQNIVKVYYDSNGVPVATRSIYTFNQINAQGFIYDESTDSFISVSPDGNNNFRFVGGPADSGLRQLLPDGYEVTAQDEEVPKEVTEPKEENVTYRYENYYNQDYDGDGYIGAPPQA
jgi:YD repeat-containing protein